MTSARLQQIADELKATAAQLQATADELRTGGTPAAHVIRVHPGDDLAAAYWQLDHDGGGTLLLDAGQTYDHVHLMAQARDLTAAPILITTDNATDLPKDGEQVTREHLPGLAMLRSSTTAPTLAVGTRARHLQFRGIAFGPTPFVERTLVELGTDTMTDPDEQPEHLLFDRVLFYGQPLRGQHRGLTCHARHVTITGCGFYDFCEPGRDSQAIGAWNGGHDVVVENCDLEGSAENVMLGGGDSMTAAMIPARWKISRCRIRKDPAWVNWPGGPKAMNVKALVEIKAAIDVEIVGCELAHCWADDWAGGVAFAIKCANPGKSPWTVTSGIHVHHCRVSDVDVLALIVGWGDSWTPATAATRVTERMHDIRIEHLLALGVRTHGVRVNNPPDRLTLDHLTVLAPSRSFLETWFHGGQPVGQDFAWTNSVLTEGKYGIKRDGGSTGVAALRESFAAWTFKGHLIAGSDPRRYPESVKVAPAIAVDGLDGELRVAQDFGVVTTDGLPPGADVDQIQQAMQG